MKYIYSIQGAFIAFWFFLIMTFIFPRIGSNSDVEIILTVSTFLFAIITGFFISRLNERYNTMVELIALEDARWLSLYECSAFYGKRFLKKITDAMDKYYIVAYDFDIGKCYKHNACYLKSIYAEIKNLKIKFNGIQENVIDDMVVFLCGIEECRNRSSVLARSKITRGQWTVITTLAVIIIFSIFMLRSTALYSQMVAVFLSTAVVLIILIVRDLQNLRLNGGKSVLTESGQEVFEAIGKLRYFNQMFIKNDFYFLPSDNAPYRLGLHKPGEKFNINIVNKK